MNENLNSWERLRKAFESFEPDVTGNWEGMKSRLDVATGGGSGLNDYFIRRAKIAERFAVAASAVAIAMGFWVSQQHEDDLIAQEIVVIKMDQSLDGQVVSNVVADIRNTSAPIAHPWEDLKVFVAQEPSQTSISKLEDEQEPQAAVPSISNAFFVDAETGIENSAIEESLAKSNVARVEANSLGNVKEGDYSQEFSSASEAKANPREKILPTDSPGMIDYLPAVSVQEACAGTEVEFALRGFTDQGSVLWNFGDGSFSQSDAPIHVFNDAGTYDITVSIRDHGDGTIRTRTVENMIVIRPKPEAKMDWAIEIAQLEMASVELSDLTENASSSAWLLREKEITNSTVDLSIPGDYNVNLVASNKFGCQDVKSEVVKLGDRQSANAAAVFSPNDDGRYDLFLPLITHELEGEWVLTIFDGENQPAFTTNRVSKPWNGVFDNGALAINKVSYRWELLAETLSGKKMFFSDQIKVEK